MGISIYDGTELIETRACRRVTLPDGSPGAVWRGLAYPLRSGDSIDIADEGVPPGRCGAQPRLLFRYALIDGVDEAYLILDGSVIEAETTAAALQAGGITVLRRGRYLGDPVGTIAGDWFIRFIKPNLPTGFSVEIERLLGPATAGEAGDEVRIRLLTAELATAKAREASLRSEIARLSLAQAEDAAAERARRATLEAALVEERTLREAAELAAAIAVEATPAPPPRAVPPTKLRDEIALVLDSFLPRIRLIRDSLDVIAAEFGSRRALYRGLAELQQDREGMPPTWKRVKGAEGWWERHIATGQDDSGRIYVRLGADRRWDTLVSYKAQQTRDMAWIVSLPAS